MNVVLLVVDSLRAASLALDGDRPGLPRTPFLAALSRSAQYFRRAYATECWTLPAHASMFTGLPPSQHQAHFQTMAYTQPAPTVAEVLAAAKPRFRRRVQTTGFFHPLAPSAAASRTSTSRS